jgi:alpha-L-rhamnosidase
MKWLKDNWCLALLGIASLSPHVCEASNTHIEQSQIIADRPNIIFILTDDQRWDALGHAGNAIIHTPQMDQLATSGAYFSKALVTTPICSASRASILTGLHERTHRYTFQTGPIREEYMQQAYPLVLRNNGYYTGFFGKFGVRYNALDKLFDEYEDYDRANQYKDRRGFFYQELGGEVVHLTRYTGQQALDFIANAPTDRPFCLSLSFSAPHAHDPAEEQYFWTPETDHLYRDMEMPGPMLGEDKYFNMQPEFVRKGFNRTRWYWRFDTPEKYQHSLKGYYRMIADIDLEIAKIRKQLQQQGLDDNTVIMLMGDNGYFLGERQCAGKWLMYDNSIRVPLIIYDPRADKPRHIEQMALNIDVPSTVLDMAGIAIPKGWHGQSLYPLVAGKTDRLDRDAVLIEHLWEFESIPPSEGVRTDQWKYFRYVNNKTCEELYDLKKDPIEVNNVATEPKYQATLAELRKRCDALSAQYDDPYSQAPHELTVEYIRQPEQEVYIVNDRPRYGWVVPDPIVTQNAYQILVASSRESCRNNIGDIWDSGQVRSRQSSNIEHNGTPLKAQTQYFWKVRIWDRDNRLSNYSEVQSFRTASFGGDTVSTANRFHIERISPIALTQTSDTSVFLDFGKAAFGTLELTYAAPAKGTLIIRLGEKLAGKKMDRKPGGTIRFQEVELAVEPGKTSYTVPLKPDARNTNHLAIALPESFGVIMPFRYCEIDNVQGKLTVDDVRQKAFFYYWDGRPSSFTCSDDILNQVWDLCKYSMKATSFCGLYVDGDRERIPYEADAYINQLSHYAVDAEYAIAKQTIEYFMEHPTWPTEWPLHTAMMMYEDYYYTGDARLIQSYYDQVRHKTLMALAREDGLISAQTGKVTEDVLRQIGFKGAVAGPGTLRDIVDWPQKERDGYDMVPINTVVNCFFYRNMVIMAEFARLLGNAADADHFDYMAGKVKQSINTKLFDRARGIYIDGEGSSHASLHANMMPLAFGVVPPRHVSSVVAFVKSRGMACSVYGAQYLLEGLYRAGEDQYALDLMRATDDRSWWNMITAGSTITLEAWDIKYKPNLDWNHAWGAVPGNIIARYLWGIQPVKPGFELVRIQPQLADLKNSRIVKPTIKGPIECTFTVVNPRLDRYTIHLPANVAGECVLPSAPDRVLTLNGETVNAAFESIRLNPGLNQIESIIHSF